MTAYSDSLRTISPRPTMETIATLIDGTLTDWLPVYETWTYASATTITIPSGGTARFQIGDKIKLTNSTVKYFVVSAVASTTLTVTGGTDYTVANAAISSIYVSRAAHPLGFPGAFAYSPTVTGFSSAPAGVFRWMTSARHCTVLAHQTAHATSNATSFTISLPFTAATVANMTWCTPQGAVYDNGSWIFTGTIAVASAGTVANVYTDGVGSAFTASGNKRLFWGKFDYEF